MAAALGKVELIPVEAAVPDLRLFLVVLLEAVVQLAEVRRARLPAQVAMDELQTCQALGALNCCQTLKVHGNDDPMVP